MREARRYGLEVVGVVMNESAPIAPEDDPSLATNAELIESRGGVPVLARVPWLGEEIDRERLARLDLDRLVERVTKEPTKEEAHA